MPTAAALAAGTLTALTLAAATPAATHGTLCVPLVIARSGQPTVVQALHVPAGTSGLTLLEETHPVRQDDGLVCAIDGFPSSGCTKVTSTGDQYWAYWHRAPHATSWVYSQVGAGESTVTNGVAEGWSWQDGDQQANVPPPDVDVARLCAAPKPTPPPSPSPEPSSTERPSPAPTTAGPAGRHPVRRTTQPTRMRAPPGLAHGLLRARAGGAASAGSPIPDRRVSASAASPGHAVGWWPIGVVAGVVVLGGGALLRARRTG